MSKITVAVGLVALLAGATLFGQTPKSSSKHGGTKKEAVGNQPLLITEIFKDEIRGKNPEAELSLMSTQDAATLNDAFRLWIKDKDVIERMQQLGYKLVPREQIAMAIQVAPSISNCKLLFEPKDHISFTMASCYVKHIKERTADPGYNFAAKFYIGISINSENYMYINGKSKISPQIEISCIGYNAYDSPRIFREFASFEMVTDEFSDRIIKRLNADH